MARTATDAPAAGRIARFTPGERALHWLLASTVVTMLASGFALLIPAVAVRVDRPAAKAVHLGAAVALLAGVAVLAAVHGRRLLRTLRDLDRFDRDDLRWLRGVPRRVVAGGTAPPQGRFNAGQKLNSAIVGGLMVVAYVTGGLLWLAERDTRFRLDGSVIVHDWVTWLFIPLIAGHVYMAAFRRDTRHSLRGMTSGRVDRAWAERHHEKWVRDVDGG